jgi:hypothetical protein
MGTPRTLQTVDDLLEVGKWTDGMINARPGKDIPKTALQDAQNVNISDAGSVIRRKGYKLEVGAVNGKGNSCFADEYGLYFCDGSDLIKAVNDGGTWTTKVIRSDLTVNKRMSWVKGQGQTWYSNGIQKGKFVFGEHAPFSVETPASQPTVSSSSGDFSAGRVGIAVSFVNKAGEESGTQIRVYVDVLDNGGVRVSDLPQPSSKDIAHIRVYSTDSNGTLPYKYADIPVGIRSITVTRSNSKGLALFNELTDEFPACEQLEVWRGFMLGVQENILWYSEPMRFGLCQLQSNFIIFEAPITNILALDDGFYVVADKTYFISGGQPDNWTRREVLPYGEGVKGTTWKHPTKVEGGWFSAKGEIVCRPGGELNNRTLEKIAPNRYKEGAVLFRREDGIEHLINVFPDQGSAQVMGASSFTDAKIIRARK